VVDEDPKCEKLEERVTRLEEDNKWYKEKFNEIEKRVESIDNRSWYILGGVIITLITTAIDIIVRLLH